MKDRIKQVRQFNHLTQEVFASRICITKSSVSLIESGKNNPSDQTIKLICSEFGIRREWLEFGHEPMREADMEKSPETLVPELVAILSDNPALLDLARRAAKLMTVSDWKRLNALLSELLYPNEKTPEA